MMAGVEDKKLKRAAANVNERRRMQNINYGFEALRSLIDVQNSSKLSKSAILRHAVEMLRNLVSENQQLREQNKFMRDLYCNYGTPSLPIIPTPQLTRSFKKDTTPNLTEDRIEAPSPSKTEKLSKQDEDPPLSTENQRHSVTFSLLGTTEQTLKSPRKYSPHINKLLASPKRMTRSSVIQQNVAYTPNSTSTNPLLESPSRRSLRLIEKDHLQTPTSTRVESEFLSNQFLYQSPMSAKKLSFDDPRHYMMLTPESMKMIPPRSAKRSLDAIIHAIDQIEKS